MYKEIIKHTTQPHMAYIVLGLSYQPFDETGLDAYYLATQEMYRQSYEMQNELRSKGAYARVVNDVSLRDLAFKSGLATILGINQMAMRDDCGSWLVLGAIETDDKETVASAKNTVVQKVDKCIDCGECVRECPTGALGYNGEFDATLCLRSYQCGDVVPPEIADKIGKRFLGCEICQAVCPHNFHVPSVPVPQDVADALKNSIHTIAPFKKLIGVNYARAKYLTANSITYAANTFNKDALPKLKSMTSDEKYGEMARWAIKKIESSG